MDVFVAPASLPATPAARRASAPLAGRDAGATRLYALLMARSGGLANDDLFARMLLSQAGGLSALPAGLGLGADDFRALMGRHFPGFTLPAKLANAPDLSERSAEWNDLLALLMEFRAADPSATWMAIIVATACMGGDHLWQDLGLWSRADLTQLMYGNFPALSARNDRDMKWKKFLYKQLCERAGVYVCRSPSCEVCVDYTNCFGGEE